MRFIKGPPAVRREPDPPLTKKELEIGFAQFRRNFPELETDDELKPFLKIIQYPKTCRLREARKALRIPPPVVAQRLEVAVSNYYAFEKREVAGTITLSALATCAAALECDLVYALVPRKKVLFSQIVWEELLPAARVHHWISKCDPKRRAGALAAMARNVMKSRGFRQRHRASPG
jgi:transcriptional regulator with XRE-family HTH domain